jgi:hypothetical protein
MNVVCIKNKGYEHRLTIGKNYDVIEDDRYNYWIIDNIGYNIRCPKYWFNLLSEIRNDKINKLLKNESKMYK